MHREGVIGYVLLIHLSNVLPKKKKNIPQQCIEISEGPVPLRFISGRLEELGEVRDREGGRESPRETLFN